jgi:hypothetical protein
MTDESSKETRPAIQIEPLVKTAHPKSPSTGEFTAAPKPDGSASPKAPDTTSQNAPPPAKDD